MKLDQASRSKLWKEKYDAKQVRHEKKAAEMGKRASPENKNSPHTSKAQRIASAMEVARKRLIESHLN